MFAANKIISLVVQEKTWYPYSVWMLRGKKAEQLY